MLQKIISAGSNLIPVLYKMRLRIAREFNEVKKSYKFKENKEGLMKSLSLGVLWKSDHALSTIHLAMKALRI